ncbi:MAG TPA: hypothetical protein H9742_14130 [Candidatus Acetatifactor stercoripullorum]|uniref:Head decoration protein n=1 Tax=Candidatus Acetatifactor stercoripullorum TaxID=2838414 RepID=A0A9D1UCB6_9FIRM|nr:hypothetical protein [Candidatus Acetatifactor stercoripullorum]
MAFHKTEQTYERPNFLDSEVGLVLKTREIPQSMGKDQDNRKIVAGGTPFPSNDSSAAGIVFETIDVTDDEKRPGSVIVAGRIIKANLPVTLDGGAETALKALGIVFV